MSDESGSGRSVKATLGVLGALATLVSVWLVAWRNHRRQQH